MVFRQRRDCSSAENRPVFDPGDADDALADEDGDGMSNYAEFAACTDPRGKWSAVRLSCPASQGRIHS